MQTRWTQAVTGMPQYACHCTTVGLFCFVCVAALLSVCFSMCDVTALLSVCFTMCDVPVLLSVCSTMCGCLDLCFTICNKCVIIVSLSVCNKYVLLRATLMQSFFSIKSVHFMCRFDL